MTLDAVVSPHGLRRMIDVDGGFTVDLRSGRPVERGISLCSRPSRSLRFPRESWNDRMVEAWLVSNVEIGFGRARHVGGWLDPRSDHVWLDLVRVVSPALRPIACVVARALRQHCVFDLGRRELVVVGGGTS